NGKFEITGSNKKALEAIAKVSKTKLDPKKISLIVDQKQFQSALAVVRKMKPIEVKAKVKTDTLQAKKDIAAVGKIKVPDKTVKLKGNKTDFDTMIARAKATKVPDKTTKLKGDKRNFDTMIAGAKAAKVPDKTVKLKGNKTDFQNKFNSVEASRPKNKTVYFSANASEVWNTINAINRASVHVNARIHRANGGVVYGAGTSTSDSIPAMLSNGEYVMTAAAVHRLGVSVLDGLNYGGTKSMQAANTGGGNAALIKAVEGLRADIHALAGRNNGELNSQDLANAVRGVFDDGVKLKLDSNGREVMAGMLASPISRELNKLSELGR
ncbi:hypothetical protein CJI54_04870, partial [Bifidobacteriaceae bacterium NR026]